MKLITRDTDYAIAALIYLAKHDGVRTPASELARKLYVSHAFLRKILRILGNKKIVRSRKGVGGGFILDRKAADISVRDVIEIFQGPVRINDCVVGRDICERADECTLRAKLKQLESGLVSELMAITIQSLVDEGQVRS